MKDSSSHEHRQLLTYRVTFDNDLKNSPNFNEENKPFTQQNSPGRSKSFDNSSFTMHNAPPPSNSNDNQVPQFAAGRTTSNHVTSNFRTSSQLALSLSLSGSLVSPTTTDQHKTHLGQHSINQIPREHTVEEDLKMPNEIHRLPEESLGNSLYQQNESMVEHNP